MKKMNNKKGFTLIELLAVIVILGIIMGIAIPSMTGYINNSRKDTMLSSAMQYVSAVRTMLVTENSLPGPQEALVVPVDLVTMEKGGTSPYTSKAFSNNYNGSSYDGKSYVVVMNNSTNETVNTISTYTYLISLYDEKANCLKLVSEAYLSNAPTRSKRAQIATGSKSCKQSKFTATPKGTEDGKSTTFKYLDYVDNKVEETSRTFINTKTVDATTGAVSYENTVELYK